MNDRARSHFPHNHEPRENSSPEPAPIRTAAPSQATIQDQEILQACLRSGEAFDQAMQAGEPLIMEALAAFNSSQQPEGLRRMLEASDKAGPINQDPQMQAALDRFQRKWENVKPLAAP